MAEVGDETAGAGEKSIESSGGEEGALAELAGPVQAEDAGGVVLEDWDLVGTEDHSADRAEG